MPITPQCFEGQFRFQAQLTALALEAMPEARLDWRPVEEANTFAHIVRHIASSRLFFAGMVSGQAAVLDPKSITAETHKTTSQLRDVLSQTADAYASALHQMDPARLDVAVKSPMSGVVQPAWGWAMLSLVHEAEHRGNLVVHIKANGGQPPDVMALMKKITAEGQ